MHGGEPVIMLTKGEIDSKAYNAKWDVGPIGLTSYSVFIINEDYHFFIKSAVESGQEETPQWLDFGHPSGAAKDYAVLVPSEQYSAWRVFVSEIPNTVSFQHATAGSSENGWWLSCTYGRVTWNADGSKVQGGILRKAEGRDRNDPYQLFRMINDLGDVET